MWGNAVIMRPVSQSGSLKRETLIGRKRFDSYEQAVVTVTRWIETYNTIRPHSTIGMLAPVNYEKRLLGVS